MKKRGLGKFLGGALLGAGLGVLFAPKSGRETRSDLKKKFDLVLDNIKTIDASDVKESIKKRVEELQNELMELDKEKVLKVAKSKARKLEKKIDELLEVVREKGTPVLEKSVNELKVATKETLKKIVDKLDE